MADTILKAEHLTKTFINRIKTLTAVDAVSFELKQGECLGIVGESGSGKSTIAKMLTHLESITDGKVILKGKDITHVKGKELREIYQDMQMVFQMPMESFDPRCTLGDGIGESLRNMGLSRAETRRKVAELLEKQTGRYVKLPYGLTATRVYNVIEIMGKRKETEKICLPIDTDRLPENLLAGEWKFSFKKFLYDGNTDKIPRKMYTKWFDYDKIKDSLAIRNRRKGDYFVLDAAGHHKKLEDYFVNEKIPASHRDEQLLLAGEDEIFWIVGGRMAYGTGISDATRWVLEITASNSSH